MSEPCYQMALAFRLLTSLFERPAQGTLRIGNIKLVSERDGGHITDERKDPAVCLRSLMSTAVIVVPLVPLSRIGIREGLYEVGKLEGYFFR